jgi:hypothetical protein
VLITKTKKKIHKIQYERRTCGILHMYIYLIELNHHPHFIIGQTVDWFQLSGVQMSFYSDCFVYSHTLIVRADLLMTYRTSLCFRQSRRLNIDYEIIGALGDGVRLFVEF